MWVHCGTVCKHFVWWGHGHHMHTSLVSHPLLPALCTIIGCRQEGMARQTMYTVVIPCCMSNHLYSLANTRLQWWVLEFWSPLADPVALLLQGGHVVLHSHFRVSNPIAAITDVITQ